MKITLKKDGSLHIDGEGKTEITCKGKDYAISFYGFPKDAKHEVYGVTILGLGSDRDIFGIDKKN